MEELPCVFMGTSGLGKMNEKIWEQWPYENPSFNRSEYGGKVVLKYNSWIINQLTRQSLPPKANFLKSWAKNEGFKELSRRGNG